MIYGLWYTGLYMSYSSRFFAEILLFYDASLNTHFIILMVFIDCLDNMRNVMNYV
jgi:hypothetical protein